MAAPPRAWAQLFGCVNWLLPGWRTLGSWLFSESPEGQVRGTSVGSWGGFPAVGQGRTYPFGADPLLPLGVLTDPWTHAPSSLLWEHMAAGPESAETGQQQPRWKADVCVQRTLGGKGNAEVPWHL